MYICIFLLRITVNLRLSPWNSCLTPKAKYLSSAQLQDITIFLPCLEYIVINMFYCIIV